MSAPAKIICLVSLVVAVLTLMLSGCGMPSPGGTEMEPLGDDLYSKPYTAAPVAPDDSYLQRHSAQPLPRTKVITSSQSAHVSHRIPLQPPAASSFPQGHMLNSIAHAGY